MRVSGNASAERFQALLDAAPDAIVAVAPDGSIELVNAQAEKLFGYAREELLGQPVDLLVPDRFRSVHPAHRDGYVAEPRPRPMGAGKALAGRRKDGTEFPAELSLSSIETEDGTLVSAAIRDVTEWRRAAEAQAQLAAIVQSSHDAIVGYTLDGVVTSWNPGAERLFGYAATEMVGRHVDVLVPAQRRDEEAAIRSRIRAGERVDQYETERLTRAGLPVAVALTVSPIGDATGAMVGLASVCRDVSDRQRAEAKLHALLEVAPDAILGVNPAGRIVLANAQAARLFGYRRDELLGQPLDMLIPESVRAVHPGHRARYFADPEPRAMGAGLELAARRKDGTEFPAEISLSAIETEDGLVVSAAVRDVSERIEAQAERQRLKAQAERERLERQLHQSQRLESLGQLAGGVAHDFNNLLAVTLNYTAFIREAVADGAAADPERRQAVLDDIDEVQRAAERATSLTHQLLAFGRREVVQPQVIDVNAVIADVEQLLRRSIGEHVQLVTEPDPQLWPVLVDPGQLEQVLLNLAVNARDAMPSGGTLTIDTANVDVDEEYAAGQVGVERGRHVRLRVSDTGTGMSREVLHRAFEPFFTTKPKGEGSGLGLATVYGIVTQAGGYAQIYSEGGVGTTMTALFPVTDRVVVRTAPAAAALPAGGGETVLVVEDEDAMREVTRRILARHGHEVLVAADGAEALRIAGAYVGTVDLLLTDVILPHMLGKEIAERVTALRPGVRVLYMSGYAQPVLASQGTLDAGVTLVEKPFTETTLLAKVRDVLDGNGG